MVLWISPKKSKMKLQIGKIYYNWPVVHNTNDLSPHNEVTKLSRPPSALIATQTIQDLLES